MPDGNPNQSRLIQELVEFKRVQIDAGETKQVSFEIYASQLAYYDRDFNLTVEAGSYEFHIDRSAADIVASAAFEVMGTKEVPSTSRTYFAEIDIMDGE